MIHDAAYLWWNGVVAFIGHWPVADGASFFRLLLRFENDDTKMGAACDRGEGEFHAAYHMMIAEKFITSMKIRRTPSESYDSTQWKVFEIKLQKQDVMASDEAVE